MLGGLILALVIGAYFVFGTTVLNPEKSSVSAQKTQVAKTNDNQPNQQNSAASPDGGIQEVYLKATGYGYDKSEITVKKGIAVRLHFTAENAGCGSYLVIYGLNVKALSKNGQEAITEFTPQQEGTYQYSCGMHMFPPGNFIVTA